MEKLNFKNIDKMDFNIEETISKMKNNPQLKSLIKELNIEDDELYFNYDILFEYAKCYKVCKQCQDKTKCAFKDKGYTYKIKRGMDGQLTDYYSICSLYNDYYRRRNNIIFSTFNYEELLDDKLENLIVDNPSWVPYDFFTKILLLFRGEKINGAFLSMSDSKLRLKIIRTLSYELLNKYKLSVVKFSDLLKVIKSEFNTNNDVNTFKIIIESDILIIDGIGSESITSWSRDDVLLSILDSRLQNDLPTILCSEFEVEDLKKLYKLNNNDGMKANQIVEKINNIKE